MLLAALAAVAIVTVIGIVIATSGDDAGTDADATPGTGDGTTGSAVDREEATFGPVTVDGTALPSFEGTDDDPAVGMLAPTLSGLSPEGEPVTVGGDGQPTLIAYLAHWCPHCQAELPVLVELAESGAFDGIRTVAVLTGTNADAPNYPPVPWLDREGWTGDVLLDDAASTAAAAHGLSSYPFLVALDADGAVVARTSGELPADDVRALVDAALTGTAGG
jgi:thiol-disulfide isomerase/thioredoxin